MGTILSILLTLAYAYFLMFLTAALLVLVSHALGRFVPSTRVAIGVFHGAAERLRVLGAPYTRWFFILLGVGLLAAGNAGYVRSPLLSSEERESGDNIATMAVFVWISLGLSFVSGTGVLFTGMKKSDEAVKAARMIQYCVLAILVIGPMLIAVLYPGPFAAVGIPVAVMCAFVLQYNGLHLLAVIRRNRAPKASASNVPINAIAPYALQLSDVHVTIPGEQLVEGGAGGNEPLVRIARHWIEHPSTAPKVVLVTGDLIDRGYKEEWEIAMPALRDLRAKGIRVILAPGNHDIATAYTWAGAFLEHSSKRHRFVDTRRIREYLQYCAELEPELESHDGRTVSSVLSDTEKELPAFMESWKSAAVQAESRLNSDARRLSSPDGAAPDPRALARLKNSHPDDARPTIDALVDQLCAIADSEEYRLKKPVIQKWLLGSDAFQLPQMLESAVRWRKLWYGCFPLRMLDKEHDVELFVVNSNAPEPGLVGSGFGYLGGAQLARLSEAARKCKATSLVVLMHHAVCGWTDEPRDRNGMSASVERWAFLAHETGESHEVLKILESEPPATCKRVFLCCGHRHGAAKVGRIETPEQSRDAPPARLEILESSALPGFRFDAPDRWPILGLCIDRERALSSCHTVIPSIRG